MALKYGTPATNTITTLTVDEIARLASLYPCVPSAAPGTDRYKAWLIGAYTTDRFVTLVDDE